MRPGLAPIQFTPPGERAGLQTLAGCLSSPDEVLALLKQGNAWFATGKPTYPHEGAARRAETSLGQHPVAAVIACSDSRVPPEILVDEGIGDPVALTLENKGELGDDVPLHLSDAGAPHPAFKLDNPVAIRRESCLKGWH